LTAVDVRVFPDEEWAFGSAAFIGETLPSTGAVTITGGGSAAKLYPALAARNDHWDDIEIFFSDDRAVPPLHPNSNYRMARESLLDKIKTGPVHRIRGEAPPDQAADEYAAEVDGRAMALIILGLGEDAHIAELFPNSPAIDEKRLCVAVKRPDAMDGITLTPPVLTGGRHVFLIVTGTPKARAVARLIRGDEPPAACPARLLGPHPRLTVLLDDAAAAEL
jgi:6-phosphogluconolactonase